MLPGVSPALFGAAGGGNDASTVLLLHMEGPNGGYVFLDSSSYNKPIIRTGSYITSTANKKFGNSSAIYQTAADCVYVSHPTGDPDLALGTGNFTIDLWIAPIALGNGVFFDGRPNGGAGAYPTIGTTAAFKFVFHANNADQITGTTTYAINTWYHVAVVRLSGITKLYVNGVQEGAPYTDGTNYLNNGANRPVVGSSGNATNQTFSGYLDEVRVSKAARWSSNFAPPTRAYGPDIDKSTVLLLHGDGANNSTVFTDSSLGKHGNATIAGGTPIISTAQAKFGGSSIYFNGSSFITFPNHGDWEFVTNDFTIDWWEYRTVAGYNALARESSIVYTPWQLGYASGGNQLLYMTSNGTAFDIANGRTMGAQALNVWVHYAVVRSGTTFFTFRNGVQVDTWTSALAFVPNGNPLSLGASQNAIYFTGYLDEVRISRVARWTAPFTPPAAAYP
jgi:hypothetical protein